MDALVPAVSYPKMTTMSINLDIPLKIDLQTVAKHLVMDQDIVLIHYRGTLKKYPGYMEPKNKKRSDFFRNAATIVVRVDDNKYINIKTFANGKFQITGCKSEEMAVTGVQTLIDRLMAIQGETETQVQCINNVLFDGDDIMGYNSSYALVPVGFISHQQYFINNERVVIHQAYPNYFISYRKRQGARTVYDQRGRKIADVVLDMSPKAFKSLVGEPGAVIHNPYPIDHFANGPHTIKTHYTALYDIKSLDILNVRVTLINANCDILQPIDRAWFLSQALSRVKNDQSVRVAFDPQRNQGVKLFVGSCKAKVFQTGKVTILGAANYSDIDKVYCFVKDVLERYGGFFLIEFILI